MNRPVVRSLFMVAISCAAACGSDQASSSAQQREPAPSSSVDRTCPRGTATREHPVDVNTAEVAELMTLPGVGEAEAEEIIWRREAYGPAMDLSELATQSRGGTSVDNGEPSLIDSHAIDCFRDFATISAAE